LKISDNAKNRNLISSYWLKRRIYLIDQEIQNTKEISTRLKNKLSTLESDIYSYIDQLNEEFPFPELKSHSDNTKIIVQSLFLQINNNYFPQPLISIMKTTNFEFITKIFLNLEKKKKDQMTKFHSNVEAFKKSIDNFSEKIQTSSFLQKLSWEIVDESLEFFLRWENKLVDKDLWTFLKLTNVCVANISFEFVDQENNLHKISFPLYSEKNRILSCKDFEETTSFSQIHEDYQWQTREIHYQNLQFKPLKNKDYLHSERAVLMFCDFYGSDIAQKLIELIPQGKQFKKMEKVSLKMYSSRSPCEHCCLLFLNKNSNIFRRILNFIHIILEKDQFTKTSLTLYPEDKEKIEKIMCYSKAKKEFTIKSQGLEENNLYLDVDYVRGYCNQISF